MKYANFVYEKKKEWTQASRAGYNLRDGVAWSTIQVYLKSWSILYVGLDNIRGNVEREDEILGKTIPRRTFLLTCVHKFRVD